MFLDKTADKPKSGTLKSPPKGFDTSIISKTYYNVVSGSQRMIAFVVSLLVITEDVL